MNAGFITEQKGAMTHVITTFWDISTSKCVLVSIVDRHRYVSFHSSGILPLQICIHPLWSRFSKSWWFWKVKSLHNIIFSLFDISKKKRLKKENTNVRSNFKEQSEKLSIWKRSKLIFSCKCRESNDNIYNYVFCDWYCIVFKPILRVRWLNKLQTQKEQALC